MIAQFPVAKVRTARPRSAGASGTTVALGPEGESAKAYRLSRIQAEGWNAAHRIAASALDRLGGNQIESLNPYASDPERTRWRAGFTSALVP